MVQGVMIPFRGARVKKRTAPGIVPAPLDLVMARVFDLYRATLERTVNVEPRDPKRRESPTSRETAD